MSDAAWNNMPAIAVILARLAELHARALRLDVARKAQRNERFVELLNKTTR